MNKSPKYLGAIAGLIISNRS